MEKLVIHEYRCAEDLPDRVEYLGKFLQLTLRGREHLLFAPFENHRYHNQILGQFLAEAGIHHRWIEKDRLKYNFPALNVIGGGHFRLNMQQKTLVLWDSSQAYGRFDETGLAKKIAGAEHPWSAFTVDVK